jgi:hypothetical protein
MKGLALASLAFLLLVVGSAITLRFYRGNKEFKVFLGASGPPSSATRRSFRSRRPTWASCPLAGSRRRRRWISGTGS